MDQELPNLSGAVLDFGLGFTHKELVSHSSEVLNKAFKRPDNVTGNDSNVTPKTNADVFEDNLLEPELDITKLKDFYDISDSLRTCIDVYSHNICGFGYEIEPEWEVIIQDGKRVYAEDKTLVTEEVFNEMQKEKSIITMFYKAIALGSFWTETQKNKTLLTEIFGNSYMEYERNLEGDIVGCTLMDSDTVRMTAFESQGIEVEQFVKDPFDLNYVSFKRYRKFRKFVQEVGSKRIWFKELDDPRIMNALTGQYLKDSDGNYIFDIKNIPEDIIDNFKPATEIYHFKVIDPGNIHGYGIPRWCSLIPALLGVRSSDLLNAHLFKNKGIPDYIMIVEGATADTIKKQVEDHVRQNKKTGEFVNMLVVSSDSKRVGAVGPNSDYQKPNIRIEPLNMLNVKDGLALEYQKEVKERVASVYRLPNQLIGKSSDLNRATAEVAKEIVEEQVFAPARLVEDVFQNEKILAGKKIKYWKYKTKASKLENLELKSKIILDGTTKGVFMPRDSRKVLGKDLNLNLEDLPDEFMNKPLALSLLEKRSDVGKSDLNINSIKLEDKPEAEIYQKIKKVLADEGKSVKEIFLVSVKPEQ